MPRRNKAHLETLFETMGPPISTAAWSPNVVAQMLVLADWKSALAAFELEPFRALA